ncbi:unnamed protein product [Haemonchus placei]|uniref:Transmembrane protein n=1 Tax=Haemonchus placei TaxID=6290 RepID=A0A0N4X3V4_HAEPC|nr:unnamed protein product [Haemonchus placei]
MSVLQYQRDYEGQPDSSILLIAMIVFCLSVATTNAQFFGYPYMGLGYGYGGLGMMGLGYGMGGYGMWLR